MKSNKLTNEMIAKATESMLPYDNLRLPATKIEISYFDEDEKPHYIAGYDNVKIPGNSRIIAIATQEGTMSKGEFKPNWDAEWKIR